MMYLPCIFLASVHQVSNPVRHQDPYSMQVISIEFQKQTSASVSKIRKSNEEQGKARDAQR